MLHRLSQYVLWYVIKLFLLSYRFEIRGREHMQRAKDTSPSGAFLYAVWHGQVIAVLGAHAFGEPSMALSSRSKDGDYAAFISRKMGFTAVRGSSRKGEIDKGGKEAMDTYVRGLTAGISGGITIDGPKGPRHVCKPGIVRIAQRAGVPIVPVVGVASSSWRLGSWDRFEVPKLFAKITVTYGEPVYVEADASPERQEQLSTLVGARMEALERALRPAALTQVEATA